MPVHTFNVSPDLRIACFVKLGKLISNISAEEKSMLFRKAAYENAWFTEGSLNTAFSSLTEMMNEESLVNFVLSYPKLVETRNAKNIAVIMAGNIPAVGFHDAMCVLLSGNKLQAKLSRNDSVLMKFLFEKIMSIEPLFQPFIQISERITDIEAVICTGSDNSARYFESYFGKYPNIIRKNRTSLAFLTGNETESELQKLGDDIFTYYGLGCRNVSKVYVPETYDITKLIDTFEPWSFIINQHKYANNYTYNRAIMLMNMDVFLDNNFLLIKESENLYSPISILYYEKYSNKKTVLNYLDENSDKIQCIVSHDPEIKNRISFGNTQSPAITDFADGVDTMLFLLNL